MFTIGEVAAKTGLSTHTLRYYEKQEIIPFPKRVNGKDRVYSEKDITFINFICSLKSTGMSLENIKEIVKDGCILEKEIPSISGLLIRRKEILQKHLEKLRVQKTDLEEIIKLTENKIAAYNSML
ncbi:MerR family transcriptional regulator [Neobacillus soli]|uniref:MerR family transcriptional regulator n=1 Tax=Neobacillus soli TaxID=220688 RepID=UPI0008257EB0|nr:MerR family transcriptional regulator [Neobacillus soli]